MLQGLQLQERDKVILQGLKLHGPHSIRAIAQFYFDGKIHAARKRVQKLVAQGLITKHQKSVRIAQYSITYGNAQRIPRIFYPAHDFEVKETVASLLNLIRSTKPEIIAEHSFAPRLTHWFKNTDPDAHIHLASPDGREEHLFIEQDRGTEPLQIIVEKSRRYQHLRQADHSKAFRVLFLCKSATRANNICNVLQAETTIKALVWCAAFKDVTTYPSKPIWITPSQTVEKSELFPTSKPNR